MYDLGVESPRPTSFRFSEDELELLDAQAAWLLERHGLNYNRTAVIRNMMRLIKPPAPDSAAGLGPGAARFRRAHATIFGTDT